MQQGGSPYEVTQYGGGAAGERGHMMGISGGHDISSSQHQLSEQQQPLAEAASPISSRPPARSANFENLLPVGAGGGFPDDEALAGEEAERGATGNRWPMQETLALLKIRSEMDSAFRDATLKGPLWEEVSRKLAELGFNRSAKKCKEKFENVHKYYKRTKEGRTGRQDGKSYRFFKQLEALHGNTGSTFNAISASAATPVAVTTVAAPPPAAAVSTIHSSPIVASGVIGSATRMQTQPSSATTAVAQMASSQPSRPTIPGPPTLTKFPTDLSREISLSSGGSSTSGDSSEEIQEQSHRKRKRSSQSSIRKMMNFFEGLMKQVVERQVALQQNFLETIEKREEDRMIREETWKRQEMARLNKELDILAQERTMSASRDAAMIAFLQKFTGQTIHLSPPPQPPFPQQPAQAVPTIPIVAIPSVQRPQQQQHHNQHHHPPSSPPQQKQQVEIRPITLSSTDIVAHEQEPGSQGFETASSRWPKVEVLALIKLRSGLESMYQEAGPKGPLWDEISAEMWKMGYKRSAKRCKEKWENINKYFKKVKESNKKRPEDSKTCPYFHQLDALYRKKIFGGNSSKPDLESPREPSLPPEHHHSGGDVLAIMPTPISAAPPEKEGDDGENGRGGDSGSAMLGQKVSNNNNGAGFYSSVVEEDNGVGAKKPEDIVKGLMGRQLQHQAVMDMDNPDSDNVEADDDEDDDDEEEVEQEPSRRTPAAYNAQYPRQGGPTSTGNAGSFITMVQ